MPFERVFRVLNEVGYHAIPTGALGRCALRRQTTVGLRDPPRPPVRQMLYVRVEDVVLHDGLGHMRCKAKLDSAIGGQIVSLSRDRSIFQIQPAQLSWCQRDVQRFYRRTQFLQSLWPNQREYREWLPENVGQCNLIGRHAPARSQLAGSF